MTYIQKSISRFGFQRYLQLFSILGEFIYLVVDNAFGINTITDINII